MSLFRQAYLVRLTRASKQAIHRFKPVYLQSLVTHLSTKGNSPAGPTLPEEFHDTEDLVHAATRFDDLSFVRMFHDEEVMLDTSGTLPATHATQTSAPDVSLTADSPEHGNDPPSTGSPLSDSTTNASSPEDQSTIEVRDNLTT